MPRKLIYLYVLLFLCPLKMAAASELDSLKREVETMQDDSVKCASFLRIAYLLYNGEASIQYAYRALNLAKKLKTPSLIGSAYHRLAWCHEYACLLYTSPSPRDLSTSRMPSSA